MPITVVHGQCTTTLPDAAATADGLWADASAVQAATGWQWKPEGLCQGDVCLPLPPAHRDAWVRDGQLNLAAFWQHTGQPVVHDEGRAIWVLGTGAAQRREALAAGQAPDFALPDLQGRVHRLADLRGRKVLLATWASW